MRSLVNWALLGLVIDRPSYAYELAQRFEREYGDAVRLASASHVYTALATLRSRGLVEELAGTRSERQPKPHYRATQQGISQYHDWLVAQLSEERQRQRLLVLQLGALARNPKAALEILARYEASCLELAGSLPIDTREDTDAAGDLTARLIAEESRLTVGSKLAWVQYARQEFKALATRVLGR
jgi:DNA-binding PadR family transcriptional regulator